MQIAANEKKISSGLINSKIIDHNILWNKKEVRIMMMMTKHRIRFTKKLSFWALKFLASRVLLLSRHGVR